MPTRRSYKAAAAETKQEEQEIEIDGQDGTTGTFQVRPWRLNPSQIIDVPAITVNGDSRAMWDTFRAVMAWPYLDEAGKEIDPDDPAKWDTTQYDRFRDYVQKAGRRVEAETLGQILADIISDGTGRPTQRSAS